MVFYVNGKKIRYNPYHMKRDISLDEGNEVEAYKIEDKVVKFYKLYCQKKRMDKKTCEALSKIDTKRILLPTDVLLDKKHHIRGYQMNYIEQLNSDSLYKLSRKNLLEEMTLLYNDLDVLSNNGVLINDLNHENTIYHNGIYLIDPGSYTINENDKRDSIKTYGINLDMINEYLLVDIIEKCALKLSKNNTKAHTVMTNFRDDTYDKNTNPLLYLCNEMEYDSINDLVNSYLENMKEKVFINDKKINFEKKYTNEIYKNKEMGIYYIKNDKKEDRLLYLYEDASSLKMNQEEINKLRSIKTERVLLPIDKVTTNKELAFTTLAKQNFAYALSQIEDKKLIEELKLLKKDIETLSDNGVNIGIIDEDSIIYDGSIHLKNIKQMKFDKDKDILKRRNLQSLNNYILNELLRKNLYDITSCKKTEKIISDLEQEDDDFIGDTIKKDLSESKDLRGYTRKLVKALDK